MVKVRVITDSGKTMAWRSGKKLSSMAERAVSNWKPVVNFPSHDGAEPIFPRNMYRMTEPPMSRTSRLTTMIVNQRGSSLRIVSVTRVEVSSSLSATGSSTMPSSVFCFRHRATRPSSPSVTPASKNSASAAPVCRYRSSTVMTGVIKMRRIVRRFARVSMPPRLRSRRGLGRLAGNRASRGAVPVQAEHDLLAQLVQPGPRLGRDGDATAARAPRKGRPPEPIDLVEHQNGGSIRQPQLSQHRLHGRLLRLGVGVADVHDVEEELRFLDLLQGGLECGHELVRQLANEPHRVRKERHPIPRQREPPKRRIQG